MSRRDLSPSFRALGAGGALGLLTALAVVMPGYVLENPRATVAPIAPALAAAILDPFGGPAPNASECRWSSQGRTEEGTSR